MACVSTIPVAEFNVAFIYTVQCCVTLRTCCCKRKHVHCWLTVWRIVVNALVSINEVNLCRARLLLRWVTRSGVQPPVPENLSQYITSHPGQLSLASPPWVGAMSTSQRTGMMPCSWGVKAGMVHEWMAGNTVWMSPCYHSLSALAIGSFHNRALYKCPITLLTLLL